MPLKIQSQYGTLLVESCGAAHFSKASIQVAGRRGKQTYAVNTMNTSNLRQPRNGFTLVEILIVILIIGLLLAVAAPQFFKSREGAYARSCQHNLKQILGAKERWAMEFSMGGGDSPVWANLVPAYIKKQPECPASGGYTIGTMDQLPLCNVGGVKGEWNAHVLP